MRPSPAICSTAEQFTHTYQSDKRRRMPINNHHICTASDVLCFSSFRFACAPTKDQQAVRTHHTHDIKAGLILF